MQPTHWHTCEAQQTVSKLDTDAQQGLASDAVQRRLEEHGPNTIRSDEMMPWYWILLHQFTDPLIYVLLIAAVVSLFFQEYVDAVVILAVVIINGAIGFVQEYRARKAIQSLSEMSAPQANVVRDGDKREIESESVVPGDIVVLASGVRVPADIGVSLTIVIVSEIDKALLRRPALPKANEAEDSQ